MKRERERERERERGLSYPNTEARKEGGKERRPSHNVS